MKILNWMHRKLHLNNNNSNYSQVPQKAGEVSKDRAGRTAIAVTGQKLAQNTPSLLIILTDAYGGDEVETAPSPKKAPEKDTEALLLHDVLNGILTIGTLGHNHAFLAQNYCTAKEEGEEEDEEEEAEEEVDILQEEEKEASAGHVTPGAQRPLPVVIELSSIKLPIELIKSGAAVVPETEEMLELPLLMEDKEKLEQRTTLADLFAAEAINENAIADQGGKMDSTNYIRINSSGQQEGAADRKRLMKQLKKAKGEQKPSSSAAASATTKKIQKLMTRMLKKKIHPEMAPAASAKHPDVMAKERIHADQKLPRHGPAARAT